MKFGIPSNRYDEFEFLLYLDLENPYIQNYVRYQLDQEKPIIVDKVKRHVTFWKELNAPDAILDLVSEGLKIPFLKKPPPIFLPNNSSVFKPAYSDWLFNTILEFEDFGFISKVKNIPYCCQPLQIEEHPSKLSLIHDESVLNDYVDKASFKLDGWEYMFENSNLAKYGIQFDIKKFYFHIPIHKDFKKYFGFAYKFPGSSVHTYYQFNVMPYGYTRAPLIARNFMKPLITKWRKLGILVSIYFDDGFAVSHKKAFLKKASHQILCDLLRAGLTPGLGKCFWDPIKSLSWIGLCWDFEKAGISITDRRTNKLSSKLLSMKKAWPVVSFRDISRLTGLLNSMYPVFKGREQLRSRGLQNMVNRMYQNELKWDELITLYEFHPNDLRLAENDINFWIENFQSLNFRPFHESVPSRLCWTDASQYAIAGIVVNAAHIPDPKNFLSIDRAFQEINDNGYISIDLNSKDVGKCDSPWIQDVGLKSNSPKLSRSSHDRVQNFRLKDKYDYKVYHRMLYEFEISTDSNERELLAAKNSIIGFGEFLRKNCVTIHLDNLNAAEILRKGSTKYRLHKYALQVDDFCLKNEIILNSVNIPRDINKIADGISKFVDFEDYSICEEFFMKIQKEFQITFTVDRFADNFNTKVLTFNSRFYVVGSTGVNSFNYDWGPPNINWIFPPPRLLVKSLNHLFKSKGNGVILSPDWKGREFYPFFNSEIFSPFLVRVKKYSGTNVFIEGSDKESFFGPKFNCAVIIWHYDFTNKM